MNTSLAGLAQMLIDALKLHSTFPALCWLTLNWLIFEQELRARSLINWWIDMEKAAQVALVTLLALFIGYTLDSLNFIILNWSQEFGANSSKKSDNKALQLGKEIHNGYKRAQEQYGIDSGLLWPHLMAILDKNNYAKMVEQEKTKLDFFLNLSLLSLLFILECVITHMLGWRIMTLVPWSGLGASYMFYRLTIPCAKKWQDWINAAFDLYRYQLAENLALRSFENLDNEREYWANISTYVNPEQKSLFAEYDYPLPKRNENSNELSEVSQIRAQDSKEREI